MTMTPIENDADARVRSWLRREGSGSGDLFTKDQIDTLIDEINATSREPSITTACAISFLIGFVYGALLAAVVFAVT